MEPISRNICSTLTDSQIEGLRSNGISTLMSFIRAPKDTICLSIPEAEYLKIKRSILMSRPPPITIRQQSSADVEKCTPKSTGVPGLDDVLNGGILAGDIIEFYGKSGSGKTQLCLRLTAQFSHFSEDKACVLYFDMKNDFNAIRLLNLSEGDEDSLERVRIFREANLERLLSRLDDIKNEVIGGINGFYSRCKLLVIDSVPMVIYPAVQQETYSWRYHQERLLRRLRWLADNLNLTVILVNHSVSVWSNINSLSSSSSKPVSSSSQSKSAIKSVKPAMGKYWQSKISIRIRLTKSNGFNNRYEGTLEKCFRTAEGQKFEFSIDQETVV